MAEPQTAFTIEHRHIDLALQVINAAKIHAEEGQQDEVWSVVNHQATTSESMAGMLGLALFMVQDLSYSVEREAIARLATSIEAIVHETSRLLGGVPIAALLQQTATAWELRKVADLGDVGETP